MKAILLAGLLVLTLPWRTLAAPAAAAPARPAVSAASAALLTPDDDPPADLAVVAHPAPTVPVAAVAAVPTNSGDLARTISQITGVAISPLLGTAAVGAWRYFETPGGQRGDLPWFAQPWFWIPALILIGLVFAKDALGTATPTALKKPLDVAEVVENKVSGLVAAGAFVPIAVGMFGHLPGTTWIDAAGAGFAAATGSAFLNTLLTPFAMVAFVVVWLLGHVINVLILLSPFSTVDAVLKLMRAGLLATVVGTSFANPTVGAAWALVIILVASVLSGWSFRLTLLGGVFIFDVFSRRRRWFRPDPQANWMFLARTVGEAPARSYGTLRRDEKGELRFRYRPFMVGKERETVLPPGDYCIGRGFIYSDLLKIEGAGEDAHTRRQGILPPRYKNHEAVVTGSLRLAPPRDVGIRAVFRCIAELFGFGSSPAAAATGA